MHSARRQSSFLGVLLKGEAAFGAWNVLTRGIGFTNTLILLSSLTLYQYGVFQLLVAAVGFFADLAAVGENAVASDLARFAAEGKRRFAKRLLIEYHLARLAVGILLWAAFFFGAPFLSYRYEPDFIVFFRLFSFFFLAEAAGTFFTSLARLEGRFGAVAFQEALLKVGQFMALVFFAFGGSIDQRQAVLSLVIGSSLALIALLPLTWRLWQGWRLINVAGRSVLFSLFRAHGKWEMFRQTFSRLVGRLPYWLIKFFVGTEAVGLYGMAKALVQALESVVVSNALPTLVVQRLGNKTQARKIFLYGSKYVLGLSVGVVLLGWLAAPLILPRFLPAYAAALPLFYLFSLEVPFVALVRVVDIFLVGLRRQKFIFARAVSRTALLAVAMVGLLLLFGLPGAIAAEVMTALVVTTVSYFYFMKKEPRYGARARALFLFTGQDRRLARRLLRAPLLLWRKASALTS